MIIVPYFYLENIDRHSCTVNSHHVKTALCTIDTVYIIYVCTDSCDLIMATSDYVRMRGQDTPKRWLLPSLQRPLRADHFIVRTTLGSLHSHRCPRALANAKTVRNGKCL